MNKFIHAVKDLDLDSIEAMAHKDPKWFAWAEPSGRNALHYLCGVGVSGDQARADASLKS